MKKSIASFIAMILAISLLAVAVLMGFSVGERIIIPSIFDSENGIRRGLDLVGGSSITFEAELPEGYAMSNLDADMETVQTMLRQRLTSEGYTEASVTLQGDRRINVEIPSIKNPEEAVQMLGATAQLAFVNADMEEVMSGADVASATAAYGRPTGSEIMDVHYVVLNFNSDAVSKFAQATREAAARADEGMNYIMIMMDNQIISAPSVSGEINSSECVISGSFDADSAKTLANLINVGKLPFSLEQIELRAVGPQLGSNALRMSFYATLIGIALVAVFMIVVYRLPGFVAVLALGFYCVLEAIFLTVFRINLSLPGIAGIILSIGMAVDANVIIFERIKEELRSGKSVKASIDSGFKRAFTAILDSNITTLIAAGVLFWKGTGTIVGFATTLGLGVIISMFTALTITHFLLNRMVDFRIKNPKVYGA